MAWSTPEDAAVFAARKRHELCRLLGGGDVTKGLHRLLLAERRVERRLDSEHRNDSVHRLLDPCQDTGLLHRLGLQLPPARG